MPFCQVDYKHGGGLITLREGQLWCKYSSVKVTLNCIHSSILLINGNSAQCYPLEHSVTIVKPLVTSQYLLLSFNPLNHLFLQNWWSAQSPKLMNQCTPSNSEWCTLLLKINAWRTTDGDSCHNKNILKSLQSPISAFLILIIHQKPIYLFKFFHP